MFAEEQFLRRKFGTIYTDWAEKVPAFVPDFKRFKKPEQAFSWIKIIKKEINGLVGIFIIFTLFDVLGHLVQNEANYNYFISVPCGIIILMYLVLRYIKKRTALLNEMGE
jgi:protein-S-isoprenylcysteine O-methyltransferase Ste14